MTDYTPGYLDLTITETEVPEGTLSRYIGPFGELWTCWREVPFYFSVRTDAFFQTV